MSEIEEALTWVAERWLFSVFVFDPTRTLTAENLMASDIAPDEVRVYVMEAPPAITTDFTGIVEFDIYRSQLDGTAEETIIAISEVVIASGAEFFWFAFEGWFDFFGLLEPAGTYAVRSPTGVSVAVADEDRRAATWKAELSRLSIDLYERLETTMPGLAALRAERKAHPPAPTWDDEASRWIWPSGS